MVFVARTDLMKDLRVLILSARITSPSDVDANVTVSIPTALKISKLADITHTRHVSCEESLRCIFAKAQRHNGSMSSTWEIFEHRLQFANNI